MKFISPRGPDIVDHTQEFTAVEFCAGYAGLHLGLKRAIPGLRVIAFSEIEAFACANLVSKMEAGLLDPAPVWTDLKTFPGRAFRDKVGILCGGFPCQPFSAAGKRIGDEDPRHLWPYFVEQIELMQPELCFFENVDGIVSAKLSGEGWRDPAGTSVLLHVLRELERLGYRAEAGVFSASEVGAPHQRKRVFILAVRRDIAIGLADGECEGSQGGSSQQTDPRGLQRKAGRGGADELAHDLGERVQELRNGVAGGEFLAAARDDGTPRWPSRPGERQHCWEPPRTVAQTDLGDVWCRTANRHGELAHTERTGGALHRGGERMGRGGKPAEDRPKEPHGQAQPPLGGDPDGSADRLDTAFLCDNRVDELRLLGNGVVPATAEKAFRTLWGRFFGRGPGHAHGA